MARRLYTPLCTRCGQSIQHAGHVCEPCRAQIEQRFRAAVERVQNGRKIKEPEPYQPVSSGITLERPKRAIQMEEE